MDAPISLEHFLGGLPTASYSQNVGIVTTTKVINRSVLGMSAGILLIAGLVPKFSALLTTIPQCVLGGATISVFASIAMTGIKLITSQPMSYRNTSIVGLSVALGVGVTQASASLGMFPAWVTTVFGKTPVVIATVTAVFLNLVLPKEKKNGKNKCLTECQTNKKEFSQIGERTPFYDKIYSGIIKICEVYEKDGCRERIVPVLRTPTTSTPNIRIS